MDRVTDNRQIHTAEELNIRAEEELKDTFLQKEGVLPPYYKVTKHWVAIPLDERFSDEQIKELIEESYQAAYTQNAWIIPANNSRYDIIDHFTTQDTVVWKQIAGAHVGHTVYIYLAAPYSSVLYQCRVIQTNIPKPYGDNAKISKGMKLKLEKTYAPGQFPYSLLKEYGISFYRGTRKAPDALKEIFENASNK